MDRTVDGLLRMYEGGSISRKALVRSLAVPALGLPLRGAAQTIHPPIRVSSLKHVICFVPDVELSVAFHQELFGRPVLSDQGTGINLSAGTDTRVLGIYRTNSGEPRVDHICFTDPVGIRIQLQDPRSCGGSRALGNICT